ncbi:hypothetical protein [Sphingomonas sp. NIBR02145]|uniref:hypothetical protein n=1 Tax=Sphingomonas sp. NIBR02145 TaxID=3014784 RepID=UPI0022B4E814|nr:hypothetical protein [Sphingomonas sp. NIBR02145]WHU04582.1 hypothetical protein O3305_08335 [Sphingomonas sp. NIBR02145]
MNKLLLTLVALLLSPAALAQEGGGAEVVSPMNSSMLVKMNTSISSTASKPGDPITGMLIDPRELRGAVIEGKVVRADHAILDFAFDRIIVGGKVIPIQSRIVSLTSSKGNEGRDDLDNRVRIEGVGIIAFGTATAVDEGAEVRITAWKR